MKGLAWALKKPLVGIPTLDILAMNAPRGTGFCMPIVDAKRGLLYSSLYRLTAQGIKRVMPYMLLSETEIIKKVKPRTVFLGDGITLHAEAVSCALRGARILDKDYWFPQGKNIIELAMQKIKEGEGADPFKVLPLYLYPKECQVRPRGGSGRRRHRHG